MSTMGERINLIIKKNGLKKVEFARKLGIDQSYVTKLLKGEKFKPSDSLVKLICCEFGVNEAWLLRGEGEMYATTDALDSVLDKYALPRELRRLILGYLDLSDGAKAELRGMLRHWAEDTAQTTPIQPTPEDPVQSAPVQPIHVESSEEESEETDEQRMERETRKEAEEYYQLRLAEKRRIAAEEKFQDGTGESSSNSAENSA